MHINVIFQGNICLTDAINTLKLRFFDHALTQERIGTFLVACNLLVIWLYMFLKYFEHLYSFWWFFVSFGRILRKNVLCVFVGCVLGGMYVYREHVWVYNGVGSDILKIIKISFCGEMWYQKNEFCICNLFMYTFIDFNSLFKHLQRLICFSIMPITG